MNKSLTQFIANFLNRSGNYVFTNTVLSRILSFIASWIALHLIPNKELGAVIFAFQIITFILPISSFGLNQGLLRYGAQLKSKNEKEQLFIYCLKYGLLVNLIIIGVILSVAYAINFKLENTKFYLILLSLALLSNNIYTLIKIQFLLLKRNKIFSFIDPTYNLILIIFVTLFSYFFKELGYAISLIITPLLTVLIFIKKLHLNWKIPFHLKVMDFTFWRYGFFAGLSNVTTQLLVSIDIILIGSILNNLELVTAYKYVSLIPFSLLFLSHSVITTDFVSFTEKINNKTYIFNYIKNYMKIFSLISFICIALLYFLGEFMLSIFEKDYSQYFDTFMVLTIGISGILIIRGVFGNLLSSIGKAHLNFIITSVALVLNLILNYYLIPNYGILGAAITSSILMWLTSLMCAASFFYFYQFSKSPNKAAKF